MSPIAFNHLLHMLFLLYRFFLHGSSYFYHIFLRPDLAVFYGSLHFEPFFFNSLNVLGVSGFRSMHCPMPRRAHWIYDRLVNSLFICVFYWSLCIYLQDHFSHEVNQLSIFPGYITLCLAYHLAKAFYVPPDYDHVIACFF